MKWITSILTVLTIILTILYLTIGGTILLISLATIGLTTVVLTIFSLGIWYAHSSIQLGAKIATEAVNNNDRWDSAKMQSLAAFSKEIFKIKGEHTDNGYPLLEGDTMDASFTIQGIDELGGEG